MIAIANITRTPGLDVGRYGRLLAKFAPKVIETEVENEAALRIIETLMAKGDHNLSPEEDILLDLLTNLAEQFERKVHPLADGDPVGTLKALMESAGLKAIDLAEILGSRARVSEVLSGKRSISKEQAKRLGEFFRISPAAFI